MRVPLGPVLLRNVTRIAWLGFSGTGPYYLEWEYDTMFKDGDWYLADMLQALVTVWHGGKEASLLLGPFYEIARAGAAGIVQQRAGLIAAWTVADAYGPLRRPGFGIEAGFHLSDPNRQGEPYILLGGSKSTSISTNKSSPNTDKEHRCSETRTGWRGGAEGRSPSAERSEHDGGPQRQDPDNPHGNKRFPE